MRRAILIFALAMAIPATASAQIDTRGKFSVQIAGFGTMQDGSTTGVVLGGLTTFVTKAIEVGGDVSLNANSSSDGFGGTSVSTSGFVTGRVRYNLVGQSLTVPFISAGYGTTIGGQASSTVMNIGGGFKRFLNERVSFNGEGNYQTFSTSGQSFDGFETEGSSSSAIQVFFGISIYTGR